MSTPVWLRRAFDPVEAKAHKLVVEQRRNSTGDSDYFMNNAHYSGGYLRRSFAIASVNKAQGPPDIEELQRFNQARPRRPCMRPVHHAGTASALTSNRAPSPA